MIERAKLDAVIAAFRALDLDSLQIMAVRTEGRIEVTIDASDEVSTRQIATDLGAPEPRWRTGARNEWLQSRLEDASARLAIMITGAWRRPSRDATERPVRASRGAR